MWLRFGTNSGNSSRPYQGCQHHQHRTVDQQRQFERETRMSGEPFRRGLGEVIEQPGRRRAGRVGRVSDVRFPTDDGADRNQ